MSRDLFTEESREQVVKSNLNISTSKQLWTFPKKKRFLNIKTQCPHAFYQSNLSTFTSKQPKFSASLRKVFTEASDAPLPGTYNQPEEKKKYMHAFGESREKCIVNSYIPLAIQQHPGPNKYSSEIPEKPKGYSMRPKTANHRNYFVDDKQRQAVPSPADYQIAVEKTSASKFRSTVLGGAGLMKKAQRFAEQDLFSPGPSSYSPNKISLHSKSIGGSIGTSLRQSFIDSIRKRVACPGPGNYKLPSDFGHYRKVSSMGKHRIVTE